MVLITYIGVQQMKNSKTTMNNMQVTLFLIARRLSKLFEFILSVTADVLSELLYCLAHWNWEVTVDDLVEPSCICTHTFVHFMENLGDLHIMQSSADDIWEL